MSFSVRALALTAFAAVVIGASACGDPHNFVDGGADTRAEAGDSQASDALADVVGPMCSGDMDCSDGLYCNGEERCVGGHCQVGIAPCEDHASCTADTCDEAAMQCVHVPDNTLCGDHNACNGVELCAPGTPGAMSGSGCQPVRVDALIDCDDSNNCTIDTCDTAFGCVHSPRDLDGDGFIDRACNYPDGRLGDDCNDGDVTVFPGAPEICDDSRDNNCNGLIDYLDTAMCHAMNDTCAAARMLPGPGRYYGTTSGLSDHFTLSCNTMSARDSVYTFTLTMPQDVHITTSESSLGTAMAVADSCMVGALTDRVCSHSINTGTFGMMVAPEIFMRGLPAGTYYLIFETTTAAPFTFSISYADATTPPPGDSCPPASPSIDLVSGTPQTLDLSTLTDDFSITCNTGLPAKDGVFHFHLDVARNVDLTVTGAGTNYVSVRSGPCPGGGQLRCLSGPSVMTSFRGLAAGDYYVFVENSGPSPVTASVNITDPGIRAPGDACMGAADLALGPTLPVSGTASVDFSTLLLGADYGTSCGSGTTPDGWRDAVYSFTLPASTDTTVTVTPTTTAGWSPTYRWSLESTCGLQSSTIGRCQTAFGTTASSAHFFGLAGATYFVVVESNSAPPSGAGFRVDVAGTDPALRPTFEACPGAAVSLSASGTNLTGTLNVDASMPPLDRNAQHGTTCGSGPSGAGWTDMVFNFTIPDRRTVSINFASTSPPFTWFLEAETTCGTQSSGIAGTVSGGSTTPSVCLTAPGGGVPSGAGSTISLGSLAAGTYYLVAENTWPTQGQVRVSVTAAP